MKRKIDELREFIAAYPGWEMFGIEPPTGRFTGGDISLDRFGAADDCAQLALTMTGNNIIGSSGDKVWEMDVTGGARIIRRADFKLRLLRSNATNSERSASNEFLLDFTSWLDQMNVKGEVPLFGSEPEYERTWASGGAYAEEFEKSKRGVYVLNLHKIYMVSYID